MATLRRLEAVFGVLAALLGLLGLAYALFGPTYQYASSTGQSGTENLLQVGITPVTIIVFCVLLQAYIGVAASAVVHNRTGRMGWRIVLWVCTADLLVLTVLALLSIGLFLFPGTLFALVASVLSAGTRRRVAPG